MADHENSTIEQVPQQEELPGMPEPDPLDVAIEWLEAKWGRDAACPYCGINQWVVGPPLRLAHVHSGETTVYYSPEMFTVSCTNCGNTVFINRRATDPDEMDAGEEEGESSAKEAP
jgi:hypothetical protein